MQSNWTTADDHVCLPTSLHSPKRTMRKSLGLQVGIRHISGWRRRGGSSWLGKPLESSSGCCALCPKPGHLLSAGNTTELFLRAEVGRGSVRASASVLRRGSRWVPLPRVDSEHLEAILAGGKENRFLSFCLFTVISYQVESFTVGGSVSASSGIPLEGFH